MEHIDSGDTHSVPRSSTAAARNDDNTESGSYETAQKKPLMGTNVDQRSVRTYSSNSRIGSYQSGTQGPPKQRNSCIGVLQDWKLEICCCFIAFASIFAILGTLYPFQNRPLPKLPHGISINAIISIYVLLLKASIFVILSGGIGQLKWNWFSQTRPLRDIEKFDEASRGPAGAFKLLWILRGRNPIAGAAALIAIISIAIDPFSQQLVHFYTCNQIAETQNGTIGRTNMYAGEPGGIHIGANLNTVALGMQSAINTGLFSPGSLDIPFSCPTGNCTFPESYSTLGYCSKCIDISSNVTVTTSNDTTRRNNFTLPSGLFSSPWLQKTFVIGPDNSTSYTYQAILGMLGEDGKPEYLRCAPDLPWGCRGYGAAECKIYPCIKTYNGSIQAGKFSENQIVESPYEEFGHDEQYHGGLLSLIDFSCLNSTDRTTLGKLGYQFNESTQYLPYNTSFYPGEYINRTGSLTNVTVPDITPGCIYQITTNYINSLRFALTPILSGSAFLAPEALGGTTNAMEVLFNSGNVSTITLERNFKNITDSMTSFIRQHGSQNRSEPAIGEVLIADTCMHVQWKWLSFPTILVVLTHIFFVAMVLKTRTMDALVSGSHDYKSSALPLVFHGLEARTAERFGLESGGKVEMDDEAGKMRVRLSLTDRGWKFVEAERGEDMAR